MTVSNEMARCLRVALTFPFGETARWLTALDASWVGLADRVGTPPTLQQENETIFPVELTAR